MPAHLERRRAIIQWPVYGQEDRRYGWARPSLPDTLPCDAMLLGEDRVPEPVRFLLAIETVPAFGLAAWVIEDTAWVSVEIQTAIQDGKAEEKHCWAKSPDPRGRFFSDIHEN